MLSTAAAFCRTAAFAVLFLWNLFLFLWFGSQISELRRDQADNKLALQRLARSLVDAGATDATTAAPTVAAIAPTATSTTIAAPLLPVVVFCFNRADYLKRTMVDLFARRSKAHLHPVVVSQDGADEQVARVARSFDIAHLFQRTNRTLPLGLQFPHMPHYYHISLHYKLGLQRTFDAFPDAAGVVVLEEDISIAPDALSLFRATLPVLQADRTLMAVSAFNDNGASLNHAPRLDALHRTDFFGGLGWLLTRELWAELQPKWPNGFWDDWLRHPDQVQGRAFVRPELSRTHTFGEQGASGGQFYKQFLEHNVMNEQPFDWETQDLTYLHKPRYDARFAAMLRDARRLDAVPSDWTPFANSTVVFRYSGAPTDASFLALAHQLNVMTDHKWGVPRTAYQNVVLIRLSGNVVVLLAPE